MSTRLEFLNRNILRKYPFWSGSTMQTTIGLDIPLALIAGAQITVKYSNREVYISQIYISGNIFSATITDNLTGLALGSFTTNVTKNYQTIGITPFVTDVAGTLVIGSRNAFVDFQGSHTLTYAAGRIEDSLVFCFTPPLVKKISNEANAVSGFVTLSGTNITIENTSQDVALAITNKALVLANADQSSELGNCPTPYISHINTVTPDEDGNIDIFGILPVVIAADGNVIQAGTGTMELADLCQAKNKRLAPEDATNTYYTNILTAENPEWKTWNL